MSETNTRDLGALELDMEGVPTGARLYMGLSGGLDSTYTAWRLLRMGHPLLLHLCEYRNASNRYRKETAAQEAVLDWFIDQGLTNFTVHRTATELNLLSTHDAEYLAWAMGMILRNHQDIEFFVSTGCKDEEPASDDVTERLNGVLAAIVARDLTACVPKAQYTKAEFLADMPEDLISLCWWCRTPALNKGEPCHRCHSCKTVDEALNSLGITPGIVKTRV